MMKYITLLLILITFISCDENEENKINYYAECEECTITFIYPNQPDYTVVAVDEYITDQIYYPTEAGTFAIEITNNKGYAYTEIKFNDEVVRSNEKDSVDFEIHYGIIKGPRPKQR